MTKKKYVWLILSLIALFAIALFTYKLTDNKLSFFNTSFTSLTNSLAPTVSESAGVASGQALGIQRSFGDSFSGLGYIDAEQTDLFIDYNTTAFSFPLVYELKKEEAVAAVPAVKNEETDEVSNINSNLCLGSSSHWDCLTVRDKTLYLNDEPLAWPAELLAEKILSVNVQVIRNQESARWLVGVVSGDKSDERGWVYFFNGRDLTPLITDTTAEKIALKHKSSGGKIYFGGSLDDLLILYSGYDGVAFYYHNGQLSDVSKFFGLRVMSNGFPAQIIRTANTRGSVFYICSQGGAKFKLIKLWSEEPGKLVGAIDFSHLLYEEGSQTNGCYLDVDSLSLSNELVASSSRPISIYLSFLKNAAPSLWSLADKGFDNSQDRQVTSKDLGRGRGNKIMAAILNKISLSASDMFKLFLANKADNWQEVSEHKWYNFNSPTESLYWRAVFTAKPGDQDYSPWLENLDDLLYKTVD